MKSNEIKTKLIFETDDNRYIWESPYSDVGMDDILNAIYGLCVAATWQPTTVIQCMKDFVEEHEYILEDTKDKKEIFNWPCCDKEYEPGEENHDIINSNIPIDKHPKLPKGVGDITW